MKLIVTGSEGYIGAILVPMLIENGHMVCGIDTCFFRDSRFYSLEDENAHQYLAKDIRYVTKEDLKGTDAIIHLAGLCNDPLGNIDPFLTSEINYLASIRLASLAKQVGVRKFIFSSSCSVYGASPRMASEVFPLNPLTPYAKSKLQVEQEVMEMADESFCPVFLRNATVFGSSPMLRMDVAINNLLGSAYTTKKIVLQSTGTAMRPFIQIRDLAKVFVSILEAEDQLVYNQIFNVGSNCENHRIIDIAKAIQNHHPECEIVFADGAQADKRDYMVNFTKFNKYFPEFRLEGSLVSAITELWIAFDKHHLTTQDMTKFTRLNILRNLMNSNKIDSKLYWRS